MTFELPSNRVMHAYADAIKKRFASHAIVLWSADECIRVKIDGRTYDYELIGDEETVMPFVNIDDRHDIVTVDLTPVEIDTIERALDDDYKESDDYKKSNN